MALDSINLGDFTKLKSPYDAATLANFFNTTAGGRKDITDAEMDASGWGGAAREMYQALRDQGFPDTTATTGGGTTDPAGLARIFQPTPVTLPNAEGAKGSLRDLQLESVGGLRKLMAADPYAEREALRKAIYDPTAREINYQADRQSQDIKEGQNAKNMLYSTGTSYFLDPVERGRSNALERAANDAFVQANTLSNQNQTTQAQILGQAFNQGTTGLTNEANVEGSNAQRQQQGTQAGYQTGLQLGENEKNRAQQESQFTRNLGQQKELQTAAFQNQRDIANAQGLGAGLGGLAQLFAPAANNFLSNTFPSLFGRPA